MTERAEGLAIVVQDEPRQPACSCRPRTSAVTREGAADAFYRHTCRCCPSSCQPGLALAVRKEILRGRGLLASARTRHPKPVLDPGSARLLTELLDRLDLHAATG